MWPDGPNFNHILNHISAMSGSVINGDNRSEGPRARRASSERMKPRLTRTPATTLKRVVLTMSPKIGLQESVPLSQGSASDQVSRPAISWTDGSAKIQHIVDEHMWGICRKRSWRHRPGPATIVSYILPADTPHFTIAPYRRVNPSTGKSLKTISICRVWRGLPGDGSARRWGPVVLLFSQIRPVH